MAEHEQDPGNPPATSTGEKPRSKFAPKNPAPARKGKGSKPRTLYTRETYDRLLAGYRGAPSNHLQAAKYAQCDRAMARRAWNEGFPKLFQKGATWARPIKDVLAEEATEAKAVQAERNRREREAQDANREAARRESVEELAEEGRLRGTLRKELLGTALVLAELVPAVRALGAVIRSAVLDPSGKPLTTPLVTPLQAMKLFKEFGATVGRVAYAGETIVQLGRTIRGQANLTVGVLDMSPEEALEELEMAREVLEQSRGLKAGEPAERSAGDEDGEEGLPGVPV